MRYAVLFCLLLACGPDRGDETATEGPASCSPCVDRSDCPSGICIAGECRELCQADDETACHHRPSECKPIVGGPLVCAC